MKDEFGSMSEMVQTMQTLNTSVVKVNYLIVDNCINKNLVWDVSVQIYDLLI